VSAYSRTPSDIERDFYATLIAGLVARRIELGLTQEQLDHKLGLADGQTAKWEAFQRVPGAFMLMCWSQRLGLSLTAISEAAVPECEAADHTPEGETECQSSAAGLEAERVPLRDPAPQLHLQLRPHLALRSLLQALAPQMGSPAGTTQRASG
jgi:transcriptional regulator with XRE-family HTH domain